MADIDKDKKTPTLPSAKPWRGAKSLGLNLAGAALFLAVLLSLTYVFLSLQFRGIVQALFAFSLLSLSLFWLQRRIDFQDRFGVANGVTLVRAVGVCLLLGFVSFDAVLSLTKEEAGLSAGQLWFIASLIGACLALDGVDGWLARRFHQESSFGALFDQETDAALILIAAIIVWQAEKAGAFVLIAGLLRYGFIAAGVIAPWMRGALFPSFRRKLACVVQIGALIFALVPAFERSLTEPIAALSVGFLLISFGIDTLWLYRQKHEPNAH